MFTHDYLTDKDEDHISPPKTEIEKAMQLNKCHENGKKLNVVEVHFENSEYDYITNVSSNSTKDSCENYFVGKYFNVGIYPIENLQKCKSITFIKT